jgi:hypothetical protein
MTVFHCVTVALLVQGHQDTCDLLQTQRVYASLKACLEAGRSLPTLHFVYRTLASLVARHTADDVLGTISPSFVLPHVASSSADVRLWAVTVLSQLSSVAARVEEIYQHDGATVLTQAASDPQQGVRNYVAKTTLNMCSHRPDSDVQFVRAGMVGKLIAIAMKDKDVLSTATPAMEALALLCRHQEVARLVPEYGGCPCHLGIQGACSDCIVRLQAEFHS